MKTELSKEHKEKISISLKKAHKNGNHPGWSKQNLERRSYPEKKFLEIIQNNDLDKEYQLIEQLKVNKYFLDFAFIDIKVDLEIDGSQHFRSEENIVHDKNRDNYLISLGWKIYRIKWIDYCNQPIKEIQEFINWIKNVKSESSRFYSLEEANPRYIRKNNRKDHFILKNKQYELEQLKYVDLIKKSNINFTKQGWVKQVAIIINKKPQKVTHWMRKFMYDFWNVNCFKRKNTYLLRSTG